MPDIAPDGAEKHLAAAFGADWVSWEPGPAGAPGTQLYVQAKSDADGRTVLTGLVLVGEGITAESLRRIPVSVIEQAMAERVAGTEAEMRSELAKLPPLERGELSAPDFSRLVADHYKVWARHVSNPAASLGAEWGVKSGTMHGWIREARLRGFLPEAERGKRVRSANRLLAVGAPLLAAAFELARQHPELVLHLALRRWL